MNPIPGEYLTADMGSADLMAIAEKHPTLFNVGVIIFICICMGYAIYYVFKKKNPIN